MKILVAGALLFLALLTGCDHHGHDHDDDHEHGHGEHGEHDDHGHEEDEAVVTVTHFTADTELFVEFPALVMGQESPFAAHLTRLDDYQPIADGTVTVTLSGGGVADEVFTVNAPSVPGIFRPVATPKYPAQRQVSVALQGNGLDVVHELGEYTVYPSQAMAETDIKTAEAPDDAISYLKEQQWQVDFAVTEARQATLRSSVPATGVLRPRADGEVYLNATSAGHLQRKNHFPHVGMKVERGQLLATITPRLGAGDDFATLQAALDKARSVYQLANQEYERLEKLWRDKAIAKQRLYEAENARNVAKAELNAAEQRYKQSTGKGQGDTGIPILAPIDGVLAQVNAASGQYVGEGDMLFHIVNLDQLWLEARIAEADLGRLQHATAAWFTVEGFAESFDTLKLGGHKVALGGIVDPVSRTAPLIFEFDNPAQRLRAGMFANTRVFTGEVEQGVVVPLSAVFNDGGQEVVYVMLGGESFQRRIVRLGVREGEQVVIRSGVRAGQHVVSRGAYQVRLASASPAEAGHGHAH